MNTPRKPAGTWKCWPMVAALLIAAAYPASSGPAFYLIGRGWLSRSTYITIYKPHEFKVNSKSRSVQFYHRYLYWWHDLGREHSGRPEPRRRDVW